MVRRVGFASGAVIVLSLILAGCGKPRVGVLLPTSGSASVYGESIASGVRLALTDIQQGKLAGEHVPEGFELVWADSGSDPARAVDELRRLVRENGIRMMIGGATSGEAADLLPVLKEQNVICLSPSASMPVLTKESKFFFRIYPSDELEGRFAGRFVFEELQRPTVLLYAGDSQYTRGFEPEFRTQYEGLGGRVVRRIELTSSDWEAASTAALKEYSPSAVYIIAYAKDILRAVQHLRAGGYQGPIVTTSAFDSSEIMQQAGSLAEDVMFPLPPFDATSTAEPVAGFVSRYMEANHRVPDVLAAHGYDALRLAVRVFTIGSAPGTGKIRRILQTQVNRFPGVTGAITFDGYDVPAKPTMNVVVSGQIVTYAKGLVPALATTPPSPTPVRRG